MKADLLKLYIHRLIAATGFSNFRQKRAAKKAARLNRQSQAMVPRVTAGRFLRMCPGRRHAWYSTSCGNIRKPIGMII